MPPKKSKRITPILMGPVGSANTPMLLQQKAADKMLKKPKAKRKQLVPGRKRLKQNVRSKPKGKRKTKRKTKTDDEIAVKLLTHMCSKLDTVCTVCKKLQSAGATHKKKKKKAKSKGGGTVGQQTEAKLLRKQSKAYKKLGNYDANPKLAFEI